MATPELSGRDHELELLADLVEHVQKRGGALILRGEADIGKSTLLAAAARQATARSLCVLRALGVPSGTRLPFAGLHQLLHPLLPGVKLLPG